MTIASDLRKYIQLVEAYALAYKYAFRSWYHPDGNRFVKVIGATHHSKHVAENPDEYGLTAEDLPPGSDPAVRDRDTAIMNLMTGQGWIRIAGADRNNPERYMIFEGMDLKTLRKAVKMFFQDMKGELRACTVKVRSGQGDGGEEYPMRSRDEIVAFVAEGVLPDPVPMNADGAV